MIGKHLELLINFLSDFGARYSTGYHSCIYYGRQQWNWSETAHQRNWL